MKNSSPQLAAGQLKSERILWDGKLACFKLERSVNVQEHCFFYTSLLGINANIDKSMTSRAEATRNGRKTNSSK